MSLFKADPFREMMSYSLLTKQNKNLRSASLISPVRQIRLASTCIRKTKRRIQSNQSTLTVYIIVDYDLNTVS
jgi:hypothetical protein